MTHLEALVSLNMVYEIGSIRLKKLLEAFGKPENILNASVYKLKMVSGIGEQIASKVASLKKQDISKEFLSVEKLGLKIITLEDSDYPENLKEISDPPIVLYVKGELKAEDKLGVGIVGSRRATFYGLQKAQEFASGLCAQGFTIVSGMARGVDTQAHRGALKSGGRTIAVIGSGFNHIYPEENIELAAEISKSGAVISEFPVNALPLKQNFPCRNRVISGLSLGVLVAEAARNSGALITADFALEQGREVFALPGKVDSFNSCGTNELIKQGAKLVTCVEDIVEEFAIPLANGIELSLRRNEATEAISKEGLFRSATFGGEARNDSYQAVPLTADSEALVYSLISGESVLMDELAEKTRLDIPEVSDILLRLQIKGLVKQLAGKQFIAPKSI